MHAPAGPQAGRQGVCVGTEGDTHTYHGQARRTQLADVSEALLICHQTSLKWGNSQSLRQTPTVAGTGTMFKGFQVERHTILLFSVYLPYLAQTP